jgi:hypothetical protein
MNVCVCDGIGVAFGFVYIARGNGVGEGLLGVRADVGAIFCWGPGVSVGVGVGVGDCPDLVRLYLICPNPIEEINDPTSVTMTICLIIRRRCVELIGNDISGFGRELQSEN